MNKRVIILFVLSSLLLTSCATSPESGSKIKNFESDHFAVQEDKLDISIIAENNARNTCGQSDPPHSIIQFYPTTNSIYSDDHTMLLYENYYSARFASDDVSLEKWVMKELEIIADHYKETSDHILEYAQEDYSGSSVEFYSYSNYLSLETARHDSSYMSLLTTNSVYSGGPHPSSMLTSYNLDLENRELLTLEDIIQQDNISVLYEKIINRLQEKMNAIGGLAFYDGYESVVKSMMRYGNMTSNWYLNDSGLVIFFNQYEIAPYAAGTIKIVINYAELNNILKPQFFPSQNTESREGEPYIKREQNTAFTIPIADGPSVYIGFHNTVHQIRISEVIWLEDQPISQYMLFSANELHEDDTLKIIGGFDDTQRSFALEYNTSENQKKVLYIHADSLSEKP